jgi:hypothetical protein
MAPESLYELLDLTFDEVVLREPFLDHRSAAALYGRVLLDCARHNLKAFDGHAQALCELLGAELLSLGCALMDLRRAQIDGSLSLPLLRALNVDLVQAERLHPSWAAEFVHVLGQCYGQLGHRSESVRLYRRAGSLFSLGGAHRKAAMLEQRIRDAGPSYQAHA